jgi:hypothetical protein
LEFSRFFSEIDDDDDIIKRNEEINEMREERHKGQSGIKLE